MVNEITINRLENMLTEVIDFSGTKEQTTIVSNMEVVNASPTGLSGFVTIKDDRDGDTILATKIPGVTYTAGDLVNVLFIDGTEPIAFQQASASASTNGLWQLEGGTGPGIFYNDGSVGIKETTPVTSLEVTTSTARDGGIFGAAYAGNFTTDSFAAFAHSDNRPTITTDYALLQSDTEDTFVNAQGARSIIFRQANTNEFMSMDTAEIVVNDDHLDRDFRIEGDTEANLFFVDAGNDRIGIYTGTPDGTFEIEETYTDSAPHTAAIVEQTWSPSSTSGNVFPTVLDLRPTYDTTHTPAGGSILTSFRLFVEVADSGVIPVRNIDMLSTNSGAGTVATIDELFIRPAVNSGGGVITQYRALVISETTVAGTNIGILQSGASMINTFFGDIRVGTNNTGGKVFIDQNNLTGARPPLFVRQRDVSEEFISFRGSAAAATLTQSIVDEGDVTTATRQGFIKVFVQDDGNQITDQAYFMPLFTLA